MSECEREREGGEEKEKERERRTCTEERPCTDTNKKQVAICKPTKDPPEKTKPKASLVLDF